MSSLPSDLWLPLALFVFFGLLSVAGTYLALNALRDRRAAILGAAATAGFFALLLAVVLNLMRNAGLVP
jgi:drug/metabolite transporter superfamily protein YnfA